MLTISHVNMLTANIQLVAFSLLACIQDNNSWGPFRNVPNSCGAIPDTDIATVLLAENTKDVGYAYSKMCFSSGLKWLQV